MASCHSSASGGSLGGPGCGTGRGNFGRSSRGRGRFRGDLLCTHCQGTNHIVDHCWVLHGKPKHMAHSVIVDDPSSHPAFTPPPRMVSMSEEAYQRYLAHLTMSSSAPSSKPTSSAYYVVSGCSWILDSGVTDDITGSFASFQQTTVLSRPIRLADGSTTSADGSPNREDHWIWGSA